MAVISSPPLSLAPIDNKALGSMLYSFAASTAASMPALPVLEYVCMPLATLPGIPIIAPPTAPPRAAFRSSSFHENGLYQLVFRSPFTLSSNAFCAPSWYPSGIALAADINPARAMPFSIRLPILSVLAAWNLRPKPLAPFIAYNSPGMVSVSKATLRGIIPFACSLASSSLIPP